MMTMFGSFRRAGGESLTLKLVTVPVCMWAVCNAVAAGFLSFPLTMRLYNFGRFEVSRCETVQPIFMK